MISPSHPHTLALDAERSRLAVDVSGAVQGVGFRPFVYRLAREAQLAGWVSNTPEGVRIEVEGNPGDLNSFLKRLETEGPPHSSLDTLAVSSREPLGEVTFRIVQSSSRSPASVVVQPDLATCPECLSEILDPDNRRFRYPFTNCTHCGPRYSIIEGLPYDRDLTTMRQFMMCPDCLEEYEDPANRRFHAQPNACPVCGPRLELWGTHGAKMSAGEEALLAATQALRDGRILAVKGIGGFHLMADARNEAAVSRLRLRKHRPDKPLAVMARDVDQAGALAEIGSMEEQLLQSSEAPIVLLRTKPGNGLAASVAPHNPLIGLLLPHAPLQHLLLRELDFPVVATSGNLSDEPICTDENEAATRLGKIADALLVHDRPIARPLDDSVVRVMNGRPVLLRLGRGYAPVRVPLPGVQPGILGVGAHQKGTVALSLKDAVVVGQHLGDLDNTLSVAGHRDSAAKLGKLYGVVPRAVCCDLHPDYASTWFAVKSGLPLTAVQHHHAHVLACLAENGVRPPALGISWDGTGLGTDGTVWGGEFLRVRPGGFERIGQLRPFPLPGGDAAARDPRRSCFGLLWEFGGEAFAREFLLNQSLMTENEIRMLSSMIRKSLNTPRTSSMGRFFDAVGVLLGLRCTSSFEGQAAMEVEFAAEDVLDDDFYPFAIRSAAPAAMFQLDWSPAIGAMLAELHAGENVSRLAGKFHETLADMTVAVARLTGEPRVALTGGCFQNARLLERSSTRLAAAGFLPISHYRIPPNDNGISLGQVVAAAGDSHPEET